MLSLEKLLKLKDEVEEALQVIERAVSKSLSEYLNNLESIYAVRYAIIKIVETLVVMGIYILEELFHEEVETYKEVFKKLKCYGVITNSTAISMINLVSLRNLIIHRYWEVNDARIYREAKENGIEAIRKFIQEVINYVKKTER